MCARIPSTWTTDCLVEKHLGAYCLPQTKGKPRLWLLGRPYSPLVDLVPFQRWENRGLRRSQMTNRYLSPSNLFHWGHRICLCLVITQPGSGRGRTVGPHSQGGGGDTGGGVSVTGLRFFCPISSALA